nr:uncharacterized protein LOC109169545 [Ipomoea batatas]
MAASLARCEWDASLHTGSLSSLLCLIAHLLGVLTKSLLAAGCRERRDKENPRRRCTTNFKVGFTHLYFQGNGCGYFVYVEDIMQGLGAIEYESTKIDLVECKRIVESLRDEVLVVQQRLGSIEEATKKMTTIDHHNSIKGWGFRIGISDLASSFSFELGILFQGWGFRIGSYAFASPSSFCLGIYRLEG